MDDEREQLIRVMLELDGYTVIVVQSRDLNDAQAVRQHLKSIAQAMGRGNLCISALRKTRTSKQRRTSDEP